MWTLTSNLIYRRGGFRGTEPFGAGHPPSDTVAGVTVLLPDAAIGTF